MYKLLLLFFLIPLTITATDNRGKYTKTKSIHKEYKVDRDATLLITNKYGNINVLTHDKNEITIDITITVSGDNEEKVENRLKTIDVKFEAGSEKVSAKTIIDKASRSWINWGKKNKVKMQIDYQVSMPLSNNVSLNNDYGNISLDKLEGSCKINCDYGKIDIGELHNDSNSINMDYVSKSTIDFMKNGNINTDYSTLHVEKSNKVELNADYSHVSFGSTENLNFSCDYGDLKIDEIGSVDGNCDYMHTTIGTLKNSGNFHADFGSLKIKELGANIKKLNIQSSYTNYKFGIHPDAKFNITASLSYGGFKYEDGFTFNKEITKTSSKYYEGYFNSSGSTSNITIKSSYGNFSFSNN